MNFLAWWFVSLFLRIYLCCNFLFVLVPLVFSNNVELVICERSCVNILCGVRVLHEYSIVTWCIGGTYHPLDILIYWIGIELRFLEALYADSLIRRFCGEMILLFSLRITIVSVILIYSISLGTMISFYITYISSNLCSLSVWTEARKSLGVISCSGDERGGGSYWSCTWWWKWMKFWKLPIFLPWFN